MPRHQVHSNEAQEPDPDHDRTPDDSSIAAARSAAVESEFLLEKGFPLPGGEELTRSFLPALERAIAAQKQR
jgi:hypothetical protein